MRAGGVLLHEELVFLGLALLAQGQRTNHQCLGPWDQGTDLELRSPGGLKQTTMPKVLFSWRAVGRGCGLLRPCPKLSVCVSCMCVLSHEKQNLKENLVF